MLALRLIHVAIVIALAPSAAIAGPAVVATDQQTRTATALHSLADATCELATSDLARGRPGDGLRAVEAVLPLLDRPDATRADRARLATERGRLEHYRASLAGAAQDTAVARLRDALAAAEASGDERLVADAADLLGLALYSLAFDSGDFAAPLAHLDRALGIRRRLDDRRGVAETLFHLGLVHQNRTGATASDRDRALAIYGEALPIARDNGCAVEQSYLERHIAAELVERGDLDGALAGFERSLELREQAGYAIYVPPALLALGDVHRARGDSATALRYYREALAGAQSIAATRFIVNAHLAIAEVEAASGRREEAAARCRQALAAARDGGWTSGAARAEARLAELAGPDPTR